MVCLKDDWKNTHMHTFRHTQAKDWNKETPYLSCQRHFVHVLACRWIIYVDTSAYTHTSNRLVVVVVVLTRPVVCCAFCTRMCVCVCVTAVTVEGCRVSKGTVMNESVVTSQVQLPLCCLYAVLLYHRRCTCGVYARRVSVGVLTWPEWNNSHVCVCEQGVNTFLSDVCRALHLCLQHDTYLCGRHISCIR